MFEHFSTGSISGVRGDPTRGHGREGPAILLDAAAKELAEIVEEIRAREIVLPTDHHGSDIAELRRKLSSS